MQEECTQAVSVEEGRSQLRKTERALERKRKQEKKKKNNNLLFKAFCKYCFFSHSSFSNKLQSAFNIVTQHPISWGLGIHACWKKYINTSGHVALGLSWEPSSSENPVNHGDIDFRTITPDLHWCK